MLRLIARLDIKTGRLIKAIQLEGLRVVGDPTEFARRYYEQGADELIFMDVVASLYGRNHLTDIVEASAKNIFVPITVGGGVRSVDDARTLFLSGADKVAINTAATKRPELLSEIARRYGSQAVVLSIEAKKVGTGRWEAYTDNGRERTGLDVVEWAKRGVELGAGEILLTSVDREGTRKGFDDELVRAVSSQVGVPVIASGGFGEPKHLGSVVREGLADAVAFADALHFNRFSLKQLRAEASKDGFSVRSTDNEAAHV